MRQLQGTIEIRGTDAVKLPRVSIAGLMGFVVPVAVGFAALKNPSEIWASAIFTLIVGLLCVAILLAAARTGRKRLSWLAFSIFGWAYLIFTFGPSSTSATVNPPPLILSTLVARGLGYLETRLPTLPPPPVQPNQGATGSRTSTIFDVNISRNINTVRYVTRTRGIPTPNLEPFRQIGHSLAASLVGLLGTLLILAFTKHDDKQA